MVAKPKPKAMPKKEKKLVQMVLVDFSELKRLQDAEKKLHYYLSKNNSSKHNQDPSTGTTSASAADLQGDGAAGASSAEKQFGLCSRLVSGATQIPGLQGLQDSLPSQIVTNTLPPPENPGLTPAKTLDFGEDIRMEAARDKSAKASLPLNDPLGYSNPRLEPGMAPTSPFRANKRQRAADSNNVIGGVPTMAEARDFLFVGAVSTDDESEVDDYY